MKTLLSVLFVSCLVGCNSSCGVSITSPDAATDSGTDAGVDGSTSSIHLSTENAEAELYGTYCCDGNAVRRCVINPSPVGYGCFCYGQGSGWVCL